MFRNLLIAAAASLLLGGGIFAQEREVRAEVFFKGLSKARYSLAEGVMRAQMKVPGRALGAKVNVEKEKKGIEVTYEVYILRKGKLFKVEVDGITGKVKEVKAKGKLFQKNGEEEGKEIEHKGKRKDKEEAGEEEENEEGERAEHKGKREREERGEEEEEKNERVEHRGKRRHKEKTEQEEEEENERAEHKGKKEREERAEEEEEGNERAEHKRKRRRRRL